jgi:hypothetical protein
VLASLLHAYGPNLWQTYLAYATVPTTRRPAAVPLSYPAAAAALEYAATLSAARAVATSAAAAAGGATATAFGGTATVSAGTGSGSSGNSGGSVGVLWPEHLAAPAHAAELPADEARCISEGLRCTEGQVSITTTSSTTATVCGAAAIPVPTCTIRYEKLARYSARLDLRAAQSYASARH